MSDAVNSLPTMVLATDDPRLVARLGELARRAGLGVVPASALGPAASLDPNLDPNLYLSLEPSTGPAEPPGRANGEPLVIVADLDREDGPAAVREWRARFPDALLAGYLAVPDRDRWVAAQRAGCDLVTNRGALVPQLRERLSQLGRARRRRYPLFESAEVAGRLGVVYRCDDTPVGPLAVIRVEGRLCAVADRCPHAGATLSSGAIDGTVLTCPGHGSQFDLTTGERVRGPADEDIRTFPLVVEGGQVFIVLPALD